MDSTDAPVSIAVELATLAIKALRYVAGTFRCGFVSMRGLGFMTAVPFAWVKLYTMMVMVAIPI